MRVQFLVDEVARVQYESQATEPDIIEDEDEIDDMADPFEILAIKEQLYECSIYDTKEPHIK